jgi:peroxiredoxin
MRPIIFLSLLTLVAACAKPEAKPSSPPKVVAASAPLKASAPTVEAKKPQRAAIGELAPDFKLPSLGGPTHTLGQYRGKLVVLEWFNPDCPFVKLAHGEGPLDKLPAQVKAGGGVWLAINSGGPGRQGHGKETNQRAKERFRIDYPILFDENGKVGRTYGATNTPHIFVIAPDGKLAYAGAADNTRGGGKDSVDKIVVHPADAIADIKAGRPVAVSSVKAWGCSVKYAK